MSSTAIYPGTFDPITFGHIDIMRRGLKIFDRIIVAVAQNAQKEPLFTLEERIEMVKKSTVGIRGLKVEPFDGLMIDFAQKKNINVIIRGIRMVSDFEYEFQMALTNRKLAKSIETVFLMPSEEYSYVSSKLLKEAAFLGAGLNKFLPRIVEKKLKSKLKAL
jgi:pantetheine-phosphate adenylyltransferase